VFLQQSAGDLKHPPLWHGKDLYTPIRVVRAEGLAAPGHKLSTLDFFR
jgi:hypothetical protein